MIPPEQIGAYWSRTEAARSQVIARLHGAGLAGLEPSRFFHDLDSVCRPHVTEESEEQAIARLCRDMNDPASEAYNGLFLLDVGRALANEELLVATLGGVLDGIPYRQMAAFKANHSLPLQYARLCRDPDAGLEVASAPEAVVACSLGFKPENIFFANPTINARELAACAALGITAFAFDHLDKLHLILRLSAEHRLDPGALRLIARIAAPYADAGVTMGRFGLDVLKNERTVGKMWQALASAGARLGGASFHIGLGARSYAAYEYAFDSILRLFEESRAAQGHLPRIVNVGGGIAGTDTGHRHFGAVSAADQIAHLGRGLRRIRQALGQGLEVWSEFGQGYVGSAGSLFARVDFHEMRENPRRTLQVCSLTAPGEVLWLQPSKEIFAEHEQRLVAHLGSWSLGVTKDTTPYPEIWATLESGALEPIAGDEARLVPTAIFGKTCDASDALNPRRAGEIVHLLLPRLSDYRARSFWIRLRSAAYLDTGGDFNWQTTKFFPTHHLITRVGAQGPHKNPLFSVAGGPFEHRDRLLSRNLLTSAQIHEARCLVAEQFIEREPMISWLRQHGRIDGGRDLETLRYLFWELVSECVDNGLSMVRLKVRRDASDAEGAVVGAVCVKVLGKEDRPALPLRSAGDAERHRLLPMFGTEALALRRVYRISDALREKIFPMAYVAMSAARPKEGRPVRDLRMRVLALAQGASGIKSVGALATGKRSIEIWESIPGCAKLLTVPYDEVVFLGGKPFAGLELGGEARALQFFLHDLRGPHRFADPLPVGLRLSVDVHDEAHLLEGSGG